MFVLALDDYAARKKRRSRWGGSEHDKIFIPGMPTILPMNLNKDQEQAYLRKFFYCHIFSDRIRVFVFYVYSSVVIY